MHSIRGYSLGGGGGWGGGWCWLWWVWFGGPGSQSLKGRKMSGKMEGKINILNEKIWSLNLKFT